MTTRKGTYLLGCRIKDISLNISKLFGSLLKATENLTFSFSRI
jgi:hypothetical protein